MNQKYAGILELPHHTSDKHPRMSAADRAAQFSPFAALTGYEDAVDEAGRLTDQQVELSEDEKLRLNDRLQSVWEHAGGGQEFSFTYFVPDEKKAGGSYQKRRSQVKKIDMLQKSIVLMDRTEIPIERIIEIEMI